MSDNWIKALGMGAREQQLPDDWASIGDALFHRAATFGGRPGMRARDGIVLYASGWGVIFAVGEVTSLPYRHVDEGEEDWPWRVNLTLTHSRQFLHDGVPLDVLNVEERDLRNTIKRRSHIRLNAAEYDAAVRALSGGQ